MSTLAIRATESKSMGRTLADLAKAFKQSFADENKAIEEAKYSYQVVRIDILHEVLCIKGGDRKAAKQWAISNGPVGDTQVRLLLTAESKLYPQVFESKPITKRIAGRAAKFRQSVATKGLEPTIYPTKIDREIEAEVDREYERRAEEARNPVPKLDLSTRRSTALEMLGIGYKQLSTKHHPDKGGSADMQRILNDSAKWAREIIEKAI